jgi:hypothetical protein
MARESVEGLKDLGKALEEGSKDFLLMLLKKALGAVMEADVTNLCQAQAAKGLRCGRTAETAIGKGIWKRGWGRQT